MQDAERCQAIFWHAGCVPKPGFWHSPVLPPKKTIFLLRASCTRRPGEAAHRAIGRPRVIFRRDQVFELRALGLSWSQFARKVGASVRTVRRGFEGRG
jgi:hypothetical protein